MTFVDKNYVMTAEPLHGNDGILVFVTELGVFKNTDGIGALRPAAGVLIVYLCGYARLGVILDMLE